jgi:hypothetical protein
MGKRFENFEAVCAEYALSPDQFKVHPQWDADVRWLAYAHRIHIIAEAHNDGWKADMSDIEQLKYYPVFAILPDKDKPGGFGLMYTGTAFVQTHLTSGNLCFFKDSVTAACRAAAASTAACARASVPAFTLRIVKRPYMPARPSGNCTKIWC